MFMSFTPHAYHHMRRAQRVALLRLPACCSVARCVAQGPGLQRSRSLPGPACRRCGCPRRLNAKRTHGSNVIAGATRVTYTAGMSRVVGYVTRGACLSLWIQ
jgi:hypothetical protein